MLVKKDIHTIYIYIWLVFLCHTKSWLCENGFYRTLPIILALVLVLQSESSQSGYILKNKNIQYLQPISV